MNKIMTHVVAGYPSKKDCVKLLLGMQEAGVGIIELQIPFSDPIADGETIMRANDVALENGMDTEGSFELIAEARKKGLTAKIYIMSYVQKVMHFGAEDFCRQARNIGASGLIVPDLPSDSLEYKELSIEAKKQSVEIVPVISPGMDRRRLEKDLSEKPELIYLTSTKGITGNELSVTNELGDVCQDVRHLSPSSLLAIGFGVRSRQDVASILEIADIAVVGSAVIREVEKSGVKNALKFIRSLAS